MSNPSSFQYTSAFKNYNIDIQIQNDLINIKIKERNEGAKTYVFSKSLEEISKINTLFESFHTLEDFKKYLEMKISVNELEIQFQDGICTMEISYKDNQLFLAKIPLEFMEEEEVYKNKEILKMKREMEEMKKDFERKLNEFKEKSENEITQLRKENISLSQTMENLLGKKRNKEDMMDIDVDEYFITNIPNLREMSSGNPSLLNRDSLLRQTRKEDEKKEENEKKEEEKETKDTKDPKDIKGEGKVNEIKEIKKDKKKSSGWCIII